MNKHKQFHFIAVLLSTFALSPALAPVCHAQLGDTNGSDVADDSGSDEVDTDIESGGSGSDTVDGGSGETDTGSGEAETGSPAAATGSGTGLMVFQAAGPTCSTPEQSIQSTVDAFRAAFGEPEQWQCSRPAPFGTSRDQLGRRR